MPSCGWTKCGCCCWRGFGQRCNLPRNFENCQLWCHLLSVNQMWLLLLEGLWPKVNLPRNFENCQLWCHLLSVNQMWLLLLEGLLAKGVICLGTLKTVSFDAIFWVWTKCGCCCWRGFGQRCNLPRNFENCQLWCHLVGEPKLMWYRSASTSSSGRRNGYAMNSNNETGLFPSLTVTVDWA